MVDPSFGKLNYVSFERVSIQSWFQDFPVFSLLIIIVLFAWLRMGEICTSPFDGDSFYDLNMKKAMDVQIFNASLALYKADDMWIALEAINIL